MLGHHLSRGHNSVLNIQMISKAVTRYVNMCVSARGAQHNTPH